VGRLRAAIQQKSERRYDPAELMVHLHCDCGPGSGKRTSRKENRIASLRKSVPGKQGRAAAFFIADYSAIGCPVKVSILYVSTAHLKEQPAWIELFRTHCRAQSAEAAFVSDLLVQWRREVESCCNGSGRAVPQ
jgi:hypothetical protein